MSKITIIKDAAKILSEAISDLLAVSSYAPVWNDQLGWRHRDEHKEVSLYWLTKLAGISSTFNAAVKLAIEGYWFQVAILARVITEAQLSIAFTLPSPNMRPGEWPNGKQEKAIENHFKETWDDPDSPYENDRLRPHIRELSSSLGHFQHKANVLNPHDASQTSIQWLRVLSDYTHMAYPQLMELLEGNLGYILSGKQARSSFGENELGHMLSETYAYAEAITSLLGKIISACEKRAGLEQDKKKFELFIAKRIRITDILGVLEERSKIVDENFSAPDDKVREILRKFKSR